MRKWAATFSMATESISFQTAKIIASRHAKILSKGKDGNEYFLSFGGYDKRRTRYTNKRTGARLKHPVEEVVLENALHIDTEFENDKGAWRNIRLESELRDMNLTYTKADILKAVNYISCDNYTAIEIVKR